MEARLFSLRKFWTSWYIHVSGNIWRKIPENCKVGAMKLLRRKPGREKTFLLKKFETKHISVSKTRWSFYQSIFISSCFSFLISNTHQHTKCKLELALIYLHSIYFSFKNYFEDSYVWGSSFFASARLHHKFWIQSPNVTNVAWFQSLESRRRSCPWPQDSCRQRLHWQLRNHSFLVSSYRWEAHGWSDPEKLEFSVDFLGNVFIKPAREAESARAFTGRRNSHSGRGEDFLTGQPDFFTETAVTPEWKVGKWFPMWEINRHAEG